MCFEMALGALAKAGLSASAASTIANIGTAVQIGGALIQGVQGAQTAKANATYAQQQGAYEQHLAAIEDDEMRRSMAQEMAHQRAALGARGISLDSPTALVLGRTAAAETVRASRKIRHNADVRQAELSAEARNYQAQARMAMLRGTMSAAGILVQRAPEIWPGLKERLVSNDRDRRVIT